MKDINKLLESVKTRLVVKRPVFGVGINDLDHAVCSKINGKLFSHGCYLSWQQMLKRCYTKEYQRRFPSYVGCKVCPEWLRLSGFKKWWELNYVDGYDLDKDLILPGNKIYSPETCVYIPSWLNKFTTFHDRARGDFPIGVDYSKSQGRFRARVNHKDKGSIQIGYFDDPESAHKAWLSAKLSIALEYKPICDEIHPLIYDGIVKKILSVI